MWYVGALAPWLAQGAGQLRRQGGSTCHPPRPVIAAPAVVLTRPPVPTPTPETTALAARGSPLLPLSPPSPPLPLPPWYLLPVFFLCRRHLPCQPPPARLPPFVAAACLLPPLQAPSGTGAGTAGGAARGPVDGGAPVGAYRHLRLDPALLLAPVAAPRAAPAPVGGARCVHCQPGQGHLRWSKEGGGTTSRRGGGCKNNH